MSAVPGAERSPTALPPLAQEALSLWRDLPGLLRDRLELMGLEVKRAARALVTMLVLSVAAALMAMTAWALLWALLVSLMVHLGLVQWGALLIAFAVNVVAAAVLVWRATLQWPQLDLPATRRHLSFTPSPRASMPDPLDAQPPTHPPTGSTHVPQPAH